MRVGWLPRAAGLAVSLVAAVAWVEAASGQTIRGHGLHGRSHGGHPIHLHSGFGFFASYYYLPYYYPYGYYYPPYPAYYAPGYMADVAYLDTDVIPEEAAVYLDGEYMGIADDYDGFPHYLPITPGRHAVTFKADGYKSVTRSVRVPRGAVLDLDFTMPKGVGDVGPEGGKEDEEIVVPEYGRGAAPREPGAEDEQTEEGEVEDSGPGFVRLDVTPPDASVYIDGKLYGSASRISRLHGELRLESGRHRIEVVRPGYRSVAREVDVKPDSHVSLDLDLERSGSR